MVVVMADHVHMIFTPLINEAIDEFFSLAEITGAIKGASAHLVNEQLKQRGSVWQEESFDHVLRSDETLKEKVEYVVQNPVRRSLVSNARDYKWLWVDAELALGRTGEGACAYVI